MSSTSSSSSSNRYNRKSLALANSGRTRFSPQGSSRSINNHDYKSDTHSVGSHRTLTLDQFVDTLKSLKRLISHYFDQISKQGESALAGDVRRVYRRILLLYVKYRRRQNYEKRRLQQPIDESDDEDDVDDGNTNSTNTHSTETVNHTNNFPTWTMKKIVSSQSLPFTRAGFDADHDGVEDFDEIALAATRDVANIQNHCVRSILNDHQMKLPIYGLQTRWDSEIPKQRKSTQSTTTSTNNTRIQVVKKTGIKSSNILPLPMSLPPVATPLIASPTASDQELFLGSLARQLNEQTWQQLRSILANLNSQISSTATVHSQEQMSK